MIPAEVILSDRDSVQLEAQVVDRYGDPVDAEVSWSSEDPEIAEAPPVSSVPQPQQKMANVERATIAHLLVMHVIARSNRRAALELQPHELLRDPPLRAVDP